ncbi:hypothetical protein QCN29_33810 [Streptomyces sp. HNM0663]|uniref:Secreted protein n=1 Tax=Streptomyces chengmaiensis TaxID=3040919 RepID=A0ABT6HY70_9ACTN|nr:hypothetical protein [Streptomyces chengmaiensis]MDH2393651.1 hypothetical protein [Streptomyces chengmaiensis]
MITITLAVAAVGAAVCLLVGRLNRPPKPFAAGTGRSGPIAAVRGVPSRVRQARRARALTPKVVERQVLEGEHDQIKDAYGRYLTDGWAMSERPRLSDLSVKETVAFLDAMAAANEARESADNAAYREAVLALYKAWREADERPL